MKPTVACLAGFLMLVLLAGCKGSVDESGARENKGDIEASGTVSAAGREQNGKWNEEQKKALPEKLNVLYAANDGLYLIRVLRYGADDADDADAAVSTERLAEGTDISSPLFSSDGRTAGYLRQDGFYGCSIETGKEELLLNGALSFVPDGKEGFYASSRETGIVRVHMGREQEEVWKPEPVDGGWIQCEKLTLSPDGKKLAFARRRYVDRRKDPGLSLFEQNQGIWMIQMNLEKEKKLSVLIQIIGEEPPFFERMEETDGEPYPYLWPAKWSPDSSRLFIWQDVLSGSMRADGIGTAVYDTVSGTMIDPLGEQEEVVLPYNENVVFGEGNSLFLLAGAGREMALDKELVKIPPEKGAVHEKLKTPGLVPQSPQVSYDGKSIFFAASKELETGEQVEYPIWRQLYRMENGHVAELTNDTEYSSEFPVLTGDGSVLVFGRVDKEGGMSIWSVGTNGSGLQKLADLEENISTDETNEHYPAGYEDFYGRGSWSSIMSVYAFK